MSTAVVIPATVQRGGATYYRVELADVARAPAPARARPATGDAGAGVLRRYSDFTALHARLAAAFPAHRHLLADAGLPPKALLKNSTAVVAQRQRALAAYLTYLLATPPFSTAEPLAECLGVDVAMLRRLAGGKAGAARAEDGWLERLQAAQARIVDLRKACVDRDAKLAAGNSLRATQIAAQAVQDAESLLRELEQLEVQLQEPGAVPSAASPTVSAKERVRRGNLLLSARQEVVAVQQRLNITLALFGASGSPTSATMSAAATTGTQPPRRVLGRPAASASSNPSLPGSFPSAPASSSSRPDLASVDNTGLLQLQHATLAEQDQVVEQIGAVVGRLKQIGHAMNDELAVQNEMLDDTREDVDRVNARVQGANRRAKRLAGS